jgi:SAM-dependent methyltransferase
VPGGGCSTSEPASTVRPGSQVLEIGAGAGLATKELLAMGADVVAVEPGAELAAHLAADLGSDQLRIVSSDFETAVLADDAFDIATSATAFHWVSADVALPKLARVLRPDGWLAVWWNVFMDPHRPTEFRYALDEVRQRYLPAESHQPTWMPGPLRTESWSAELEQGGWFEPVQVELIRWEHQVTSDDARRLFGSFPNVNELPGHERSGFLDSLAAIIDDRFDGVVTDPYVTALYLTRVAA